jgi:hypothetical protein
VTVALDGTPGWTWAQGSAIGAFDATALDTGNTLTIKVKVTPKAGYKIPASFDATAQGALKTAIEAAVNVTGTTDAATVNVVGGAIEVTIVLTVS